MINKYTRVSAETIGWQVFAIPHFADKRGRIYAMDSAMSHMGGKDAKFATVFAEGKHDRDQAFNNIGKYMAKGMDKASNQERTAYAYGEYNNMVNDIVEIPAYAKAKREAVENGTDIPVEPASVTRYKSYDEPKRYMQAAMNLVDVIENGAMDNTVCASDGSCSGLQHFAGLISDRKTAALVNLTATDVRSDIYIKVAAWVGENMNNVTALMEIMTAKTIEANDEIIDAAMLRAVELIQGGAVDRKVTKNPVMVLTYGSTVQTTIRTVREELEAAGHIDGEAFGQLVGLIIGLAVEKGRLANAGNAMDAMKFLQQIVKATNANGKVFTWTTGDDIIHHNEKRKVDQSDVRIYTPDGDVEIKVAHNNGELDFGGMLAAVAPNVVHSFDAKHLQMVVNACAVEGIQLITIHDSFNTTSGNYVRMNEIIREQFIALYSSNTLLADILEMNREAINDEDKMVELELMLADVIVGDYDVAEVAVNEYAFG